MKNFNNLIQRFKDKLENRSCNFILTCLFYFFLLSISLGQDSLGLSIDLYNQLLKTVDYNKNGVLDETEIGYACSLHLKKCNSIKGISKLKNLKNLTLEVNDCDITEIFELENIKKLTLKSLYDKKSFNIPVNCNFSPNLVFISLNNFQFSASNIKIESLEDVLIENCEISGDVNKLFEISDLVKLSISNSNIKEEFKISRNNSKLKELSFRKTIIDYSSINFDKLINLETLNISDCNLTDVPKSIIELKKLNSLVLDSNNFESFPETVLKMPQITHLYLYYNKRKLKLPKEIDRMVELTNIPIEINCKNGIDLEIFNIKKLTTLNLISCDLEEIPQKVFELEHLEYLVLINNKIKYIHHDLKNLKNLKSLDLRNNHITHVPIWIEEMKNLEKLILSNNKISQFPTQLAKSRQLRSLDLSANNISYVDGLKYGDFNGFNSINLEANPIIKLPGILKNVVNLGTERNFNKYDDEYSLNDLEEPYNIANIMEVILMAHKNTILVKCVIKEKIKGHSKNSYLAEVTNCIYGTCEDQFINISSNIPLFLNEEYIIDGTIDQNGELYCYIHPYSTDTSRSYSDVESKYPKGEIIFNLTEKWIEYKRHKYSGKVKFEYNNKLYAEGTLNKGMPDGEWKIFFPHPDAQNHVKAILKYKSSKLHGEQIYYSFRKGVILKHSQLLYNKGILIKNEEYIYYYDLPLKIIGKVYSENAGQHFKRVYELNHKLDTLSTGEYFYYNSTERMDYGYEGPTYIGAIQHGVFRKYEQDRLMFEGNYYLGQKTGLWYSKNNCCCDTMAIYKNINIKQLPKNVLALYENGNVRISGEIKNGKKNGTWRFYDEKGETEKVHRYRNDVLHGELEYYNGSYRFVRTYENGRMKKEEKFIR